MRIEYKYEVANYADLEERLVWLNEQGADGWEIVDIFYLEPVSTKIFATFKRARDWVAADPAVGN